MTTPKFTAAPNAPDGEVLTLTQYRASDFPPGSACLCRNTAPLVGMAYGLLKRDVPCRILGRDIGLQLITIVKKLRAQTIDQFFERLELWKSREVEKAYKEDRSPESILDQYDCLRMFADNLDEDSRSVASLIAKIELMFEDAGTSGSASKVTLCTIHKSKGLEWRTVFILDWHLCPSRYAMQAWQIQQERNLQYVAVTRTLDTLVFIQSNSWQD